MKYLFTMLFLAGAMTLSACSDGQEDKKGTGSNDHVWKGQTDTMDKAKEVESMVLDQAEKMNKSVEEQAR